MANIFNETKTLFINESNKADFTIDRITNFLKEKCIEYTQLSNRTINIGKISEKVIVFYSCEFISQITIECELAIIIHCKWPKLFSNGNIIALSDNIIENIWTDKEIFLITDEYSEITGKENGVEWMMRNEKY
jgi:hypothetical protein